MKSLFIIPLVLMSLVSSPSWALSEDDLVLRAGLFYEKFTATPFTGELDEGRVRGVIKNGKMQGNFERYHDNGQLYLKGYVKNDELDGSLERYDENGQLTDKVNFKNNRKEGAAEHYYDNGQLSQKGNYKNGKMEGFWEGYNEDETVSDGQFGTGTYKNGVKVSE